jgi:large subunit ribosomal protein L25
MAETRIQAQERDPQKATNQELRRSGIVPGIYYNRDGVNRCLQFERNTLTNLLRHEIGLLRVEVNGETLDCIIREVQRHPIRRDVLHIDLMGVVKGQKIRAHVPVHTTGTAAGMKEGGVLEVVMRDLDVECEPASLPPFIELDVSALGLNDAIKLGDLHLENIILHGDPSAPVVHVVPPRAAVEEAPAAAVAEAAEPEVIRERKPSEEEEKEKK